MRILVVNAGSSSVKLRVLDGRDAIVAGSDLPALEAGEAGADGLRRAIVSFGEIDAVGHRVVHGGTEFRTAIEVTDDIVERLASLTDLAPLHQPASLSALAAARAALPGRSHIACFDTAFHATIPDAAATYALPRAWRERWPIRRFGFHGLSHAYAARRAAELLGQRMDELRLVTAHLGAGASLTAVDSGRSVDTTMGFTPLEGLVMATRSGSVDPGLVLWLQQRGGLTTADVAYALEHEAGLVGLAGTADMREVLSAAGAGSTDADLALDVYVHRVRAGIASMAAAMDGLDALVFTGGVGENSAPLRARIVSGLGFLGLDLADEANHEGGGDRIVGRPGVRPTSLVVGSREDVEIARQVRGLVFPG